MCSVNEAHGHRVALVSQREGTIIAAWSTPPQKVLCQPEALRARLREMSNQSRVKGCISMDVAVYRLICEFRNSRK